MSLSDYIEAESIVRLPSEGLMYVINDLHGNFRDFRRVVYSHNIYDKLFNEDCYLVVNGDIVDYKGDCQVNGDAKILLALMNLRDKLEESDREDRLILLLGNHEKEAISVYEKFGKEGMVDDKVIGKLYDDNMCGHIYKQYNFMERINDEFYGFLKTFKLAVQCENGVYVAHANLPFEYSYDGLEDLLWEREGVGNCTDSKMVVVGHTEFEGIEKYGCVYDEKRKIAFDDKKVVMAPSYGKIGEIGVYLALRLDKEYSVSDLKMGRELIPLI